MNLDQLVLQVLQHMMTPANAEDAKRIIYAAVGFFILQQAWNWTKVGGGAGAKLSGRLVKASWRKVFPLPLPPEPLPEPSNFAKAVANVVLSASPSNWDDDKQILKVDGMVVKCEARMLGTCDEVWDVKSAKRYEVDVLPHLKTKEDKECFNAAIGSAVKYCRSKQAAAARELILTPTNNQCEGIPCVGPIYGTVGIPVVVNHRS